jgi:hypothetical protein
MSRNVSNTFKSAAFGSQTDEVYIILLTLDHESLEIPIRATSDGVITISNGNSFYPYPFKLILPDDTERPFSRGTLSIDNISQTIIEALRSVSSAIIVTMQVVLASDPDTVEVEFPEFELADISYDAQVISGTLSIESFTEEPFPGDSFIPSYFPGLF